MGHGMSDDWTQLSKELGGAIVEALPVVVLWLDLNGRILYANPFFESLVGRPLASYKGSDWFSTFLPKRDREHIRKLFQASVEGESVDGNVNSIVTASGSERNIEWHARVTTQGEREGVVCIGKDVTNSLRLEAERQQIQKKLRC